MNEHDIDPEETPQPERLFRALRDRPIPELDSVAAWTRLRAQLEEEPPGVVGWVRRTFTSQEPAFWRWAPAGLAALVMVAGAMLLQPEVQRQGAVEQPFAAESPASQSADASDLVLLADAEPGPVGARAPAPDATVPVLEPQEFVLDVRLVRGFSGAPPEEALLPPTAGAGGADPLADLSPTLAAVIPAPGYALIGRWRGDLEPGDRGAAISERYRLTYRVERTTTGLRLVDVHLLGGDAPRIADVIDLERNRLYVFGAGGGAPDLVLALRLQPVEPQE